MAFVRIKKVKGKEYAYLVENKWKKGKVQQKTKKYLGRAKKYETTKIADFLGANPLASLVANALTNAGFDEKLKHEEVKIDLQKKKVKKGRSEAAIILNEGILSSHTLQALLNYEATEEEKPGMKLAKALGDAGVDLSNECFIKLYKVLHE